MYDVLTGKLSTDDTRVNHFLSCCDFDKPFKGEYPTANP